MFFCFTGTSFKERRKMLDSDIELDSLQDVHYESLEPMYQVKHFVSRYLLYDWNSFFFSLSMCQFHAVSFVWSNDGFLLGFRFRRESPWKVDSESTGVSSKLKLLEQELINLEKVGKSDLTKLPSLMRKQAKRYQALAGKIDDLCRRMVVLFRL